MQKIKDYNKKDIVFYVFLFIILFSAFVIRYQGIEFGLPVAPHPDEFSIIKRANNIVKSRDLNPHFFNYPTLYIYMQAALIGIEDIVGETSGNYDNYSTVEKSTTFFIGRLLTLILSIGTIFIVYTIGRLLFDRITGLISSLFISFSFLHITHSYLITVDSPMVFWTMISFLMSVLIFVNGPKLKYYIFNGIFIGLAIGTKYTAFTAVIPLIYSHLYSNSFSIKKTFNKKIILAFLLIILAFLISTPYSILDFEEFKKDILYEASHYSTSHPGYESESTSYKAYFLCLLNGFGLIPIIISFAGVIYLIWNDKSKAFFLLIFPMIFFVFVGRYKVHFERNMLVLIPFLSIFSGFIGATAVRLFSQNLNTVKKIRDKQIVCILFDKKICLSIILLVSFVIIGFGIYKQGLKSHDHTKMISLPDTRLISTKWIENNIPPGSKIALEHLTPRPNRKLFKTYYLGLFGLSKRKNFRKYDYIVASSGDYGRFFMNKKKYAKKVKIYTEIFDKFNLIKEFKSNNIDSTGPTIKILKVN